MTRYQDEHLEGFKHCIAEAMRVIANMERPTDAPRYVKAFWFDIVRNIQQDYQPDHVIRWRPLPYQIDAADEVCLWIMSLTSRESRQVVSARGLGVPYPKIANTLSIGVRTAKRRHREALEEIRDNIYRSKRTGQPLKIHIIKNDRSAPSMRQMPLHELMKEYAL